MHDKPMSDDSDEDGVMWEIPDNAADINVEVMAALPIYIRKDLIEAGIKPTLK